MLPRSIVATESSSAGQQALNAFSVSEVNTMIADVLMAGLPGYVWVEGEISNLSMAASGHRYWSLKDANATISCALFKNSANRIDRNILQSLRHGDKVIVRASLSVYKPRGSYQLIVNDIEPAGFGVLAKAFVALKDKLDKSGMTAAVHKKPLPFWPRSVAIVTSGTGAAIRDVITTIQRRAPFLSLSLYPTPVQGDTAPTQIISALAAANEDQHNEVIVLVRGGGSLEDLAAFNDESLAHAVFNSRLPVVTGVGHETDFTIVDFVSDYRAATPTAAAEAVSPDKKTLVQHISIYQRRLQQSIQLHQQHAAKQAAQCAARLQRQHPLRHIEQQSQRLDELLQRLCRYAGHRQQNCDLQLQRYVHELQLHNPQQRLARWQQQLIQQENQLYQHMQRLLQQHNQRLLQQQKRLGLLKQRFESYQQQLKGLQARLILLSPLGVLDRGYSVVFDEQSQVVSDVRDVQEKSLLSIRLANGTLAVTVKSKQQDDHYN